LGKALFEQILVELPLATFFVGRLLGTNNMCVFVFVIVKKNLLLLGRAPVLDDLMSLDPEIYRNLMFVKHCDDAADLDLDFTVTHNAYGSSQVIELMPGGTDVAVTNDNRYRVRYGC
jgi:hypothetical protein